MLTRRSKSGPPSWVVIDHGLCYACGACVAVCPPDSLLLENLRLAVDHGTCTRCNRCIVMCPVHALSIQPMEGARA